MIKKIFLTTIVYFVFNFISMAQTKEEKAVADAVERLRTAMINADKSMLEKLADEKLSYGHSSGAMDDKKIFVEKIVSGASDFVTIDLTDQTISISGNVAIVRHTLNAKTNDAGKGPGNVNLKVMLVWHKQKKDWVLLARQAVKLTP